MAATIHSIEAREQADLVERSATTRTALIEDLLRDDEPLDVLARHAQALMDSSAAQAMIASQYGKLLVRGDLPAGLAEAVVA